jgi:UDP-glucose 4-epimerase
MKILVTGGLGFIGSNLVDKLCEDLNNDVYVMDNLSRGDEIRANIKATTYSVDIRDEPDVNFFFPNGLDVIVHLAALARIQPSFEEPVETCSVNIEGTQKVLEMARKLKCKVVYAGSSSALGDPHINPYSSSKYMGEQMVEAYYKCFDVPGVITRFYNVYGNRNVQDEKMGNLLGILQKQYLEDKPLTLVEDCKSKKRDFTSVNDICAGLMLAASLDGEKMKAQIYNLGRGSNLSVYEVGMFFKKYSKKDIVIEYLPKRKGEQATSLADLKKSHSELGFYPEENMEDYIQNWIEMKEIDDVNL